MIRAYWTEINPTVEQKNKINRTIGTCRYIYNSYLAYNISIYNKSKKQTDDINSNLIDIINNTKQTEHKIGGFVSAYEFSKYINNDFIPNNPDFMWIKKVSTKATKQAMINAEKAFKRFFKKQAEFPQFKKKNKSDVKVYFPKNNDTDWTVERHRIKIPTLGFVRLKEYGYIPIGSDVRSGTVSCRAGHYFVSVLVNIPDVISLTDTIKTEGFGGDLGVKDLITLSDGRVYKNINKTSKKIKKLEKYLRRQQRALDRKPKPSTVSKKKRQTIETTVIKPVKEVVVDKKKQEKIKKAIIKKKKSKTKIKKNDKYRNLIGSNRISSIKQNRINNKPVQQGNFLQADYNSVNSSYVIDLTKKNKKEDNKKRYVNRNKNIKLIQIAYYKLSCLREEYNKSVVNDLVRTKPKFITIEDLNVKGMMKNRHLSKSIQQQGFYQFRVFLEHRCRKVGIELRMVDRWYPSSKLCSSCNNKHTELKLSDRVYRCQNEVCELHTSPIDRDYNASLNLKNCREYKILTS